MYQIVNGFSQKILIVRDNPGYVVFTIDCLQKIVLEFCTMNGVKETFVFKVFLKEALFRSILSF